MRIAIFTLILGTAIAVASALSFPQSSCAMGYCANLPCTKQSECFSGCVCVKQRVGIGKCVEAQ